MREYKIKKNHNANISSLILKYFNTEGNIEKGFKFLVEGIGTIFIQKKEKSLFIEIEPSKTRCSDFNIVKRWNNFLFEATGKTTKERKKDFGKV